MHITSTLSHGKVRTVMGACQNLTRAQAPKLKYVGFGPVGPILRAQ